MKRLLEFFLNILLWFFYYHTTVGISTNMAEINYHNFAVNTIIFSVPYIFSGIYLFLENEVKIRKFITLLCTSYLLLCFIFFSCISLEFLLQKRTSSDLILGIPGLLTIKKLDIYEYAKCMLIFPIINAILEKLFNILGTER